MEYETIDVTDERVRELAQVLASERAMAILRLLRERELSISEIAKALDMPISTVSYHVDKLLRVGLVEVAGKKYGKRLQEVKLYRASSRPILLLPSPRENEEVKLERKYSKSAKLRVITLSVATGVAFLVYEVAKALTGQPAQGSGGETVRALTTETTKQASQGTSVLPPLLAVVAFIAVVLLAWGLKKRF